MFTADAAHCSTEKIVGDGINYKYFSLNFIPALPGGRMMFFTLHAAHTEQGAHAPFLKARRKNQPGC